MKQWMRKLVPVAGLFASLLYTGLAYAGGGAGFKLFGGDVQYNGFIREETAINTSGVSQQANQFGDLANGVPVPRAAGNPFDGYKTTLAPGNLPPPLLGITALPPTLGVSNLNAIGTTDVFTRYVPKEDPVLNYHALRVEFSSSINWGDWSIQSRLRALYDPGALGYRDFNGSDYANIDGGFPTNNPNTVALQNGKPNYFQYRVDGQAHPLFLERSGRNYMVDFPALFLQWTDGNVTVRAGNQTVAWGQLLFFRIMDSANGLDLRRHLFLGRALEEYADQRESAPGFRITWQATDTLNVDTFAQQFIPSILPNYNTPYNIVPSQFILHDRYWEDGDYRKFNEGIRVKQEFGNWNWQAMYTRRYNQLGAIRWTQSQLNRPLPNDNVLGAVFNQYCELALGSPVGQGCGPQLAQTPFEVAPAGVASAEEWYNYAGYIRLSALGGLNKAIDDFPAAQEILAQDIGRDNVAAGNELDAFFMASDGLHGHIERKYFQENIIGLGGGYVTEGEPGSLLDQLIINVEGTYCPRRVYTSIDLGHDFTQENEMQVGLVMEKYQRFFTSIPATYMVFQALHQKNSDLAGLLLSGYGSENYSANGIRLNKYVPTSTDPKINPGIHGGANYVVLAALQPTDAYIFEFSAAALIDVQGGVLFQPAVQWKPRGDVTVNLFYNYVNGHAWGGNQNKNIVGILDSDDEANFRISYQF
jgi:hypothetical protein